MGDSLREDFDRDGFVVFDPGIPADTLSDAVTDLEGEFKPPRKPPKRTLVRRLSERLGRRARSTDPSPTGMPIGYRTRGRRPPP